MELYTIQSKDLQVQISPKGAEIQAVRDANGIERLWDGDPAFWTGRAPVLFPVAGSLREDTYILDGERHVLAKHGFARSSLFALETISDDSATFVLHGEGDSPGFPFRYAFRAIYTVKGNALEVAYSCTSEDNRTFYYSTGAHEAYACPEGIEAYELAFAIDEPLVRRVLAGPYLSGETQAVQAEGGVLPLHTGLFSNDTLVLADLQSRAVTLRSKLHGRTVQVDFADYPYLLIWSVPGAKYICIEPWGNLPDAKDSDQQISHKLGMVALAPGKAHVQTHTITFA